MNEKELQRLRELDVRIREIAEENGLITKDILFELVSPQRMIEAMAYGFPVNFSHWSHGRDYERQRTIYDYSGVGIPYEVVWNFGEPRAFLVETNPFTLNVLILCHVYGHVDCFLSNNLLLKSSDMGDMAREAREAEKRLRHYESKHGKDAVERIIDAGKSIQWLQDPDPYAEEVDEEELREHFLKIEREKLRRANDLKGEFGKRATEEEITEIETQLKRLKYKTPLTPEYDILKYIIEHSPLPLRDWEKDVLSIVRKQARYLAHQRRTKLLNEGWATYWHTRIMRQLFDEGLLTDKEHGIYNNFNKDVLTKNKMNFNWYRVGLHLYEYIEERWDKGQFGKEYKESENPRKRADWDTGAMEGRKKIFEIRKYFTDRMAIEEFFTDEFIRQEELYIWEEMLPDPYTSEVRYVIVEDNPQVIRSLFKKMHTLYSIPLISALSGNFQKRRELYLKHQYNGYELKESFEDRVLEHIYSLWGHTVHLETTEVDWDYDEESGEQSRKLVSIVHSYDGFEHIIDEIEDNEPNSKKSSFFWK